MGSRRLSRGRTVVVVSSHPFVLRNIGEALENEPFRLRMRQVDASPARCIDGPAQAPLYIIDGQLPRPTSTHIVESISERFPRSRVLIVAESFSEVHAFALLRLGVKGLVRYGVLDKTLPQALDTVSRGGLWAPRALLSRFLDEMISRSPKRIAASSAAAALSTREREVLEWVLQGASNKHIADRLHISERTVKFHVSNLLAKFELKSRQELIRDCLSSLPGDKSPDLSFNWTSHQ